ncbi:MAG TPA: ABC transporter family substrate-binding protein [Gemmatimonadaceae bacterium]|nr:ABC transporter family substrate-binding protein [Gemmatimonadaceae bacterium]
MRAALLIASTLAFGAAATGCGRTGGDTNGGARSAASQAAADQNQMNPQPRDKIQQGGKLTWAIAGAPANFNEGELDGTNVEGFWIINAVLPMQYTFDASGSPTFDPSYLTGEPKVTTTPRQVVTFELNPKAVWSDGTPITAADYAAQWKSLNGTNKAYRISASNGYDQIESVTAGASPFEVVVTFRKPYADWKSLFWPLYPASTSNNPDVFNTGWKDHLLTSGGPFRFLSYDATAKTYTLVANEKWWGPKPKLDSIIFRVMDADAQPTALANGEIDLMDVGGSADYYNKVKSIPGVDIRVAAGPNFYQITINGQSPELQDVRVRQALAMAINRDAIANAMLGQLPVHAASLGNHIYMENQAGYEDNSGVVAFNPDKAKQMLDASGWAVHGTTRVKDGKTLAINLVIPSGIAGPKSVAELVQNMLAQVAARVDITTVPVSDFFDKYISTGRFDFTLFSWQGTQFPTSSAQSIYAKPVGNNIQQNYARTGSDQIDSLYRVAVAELDPAKAIQDANQIDRLIWEEVHSLPLYQRPDIWAVNKNLANIGAYGFASIPYQNVGWVAGAEKRP